MRYYRNTIKRLLKENIAASVAEVALRWRIARLMKMRTMKHGGRGDVCTRSEKSKEIPLRHSVSIDLIASYNDMAKYSPTGKDEKSRAFYDAYQRDVQEDDNDDFAHLNNDDMEEDEGGDENEPPEVVATSEIQARLREVAREQKGKERVCRKVF